MFCKTSSAGTGCNSNSQEIITRNKISKYNSIVEKKFFSREAFVKTFPLGRVIYFPLKCVGKYFTVGIRWLLPGDLNYVV